MHKSTATCTKRHTHPQRRAAAYILCLGISMLLAIIGFSAITLARINNRVASGSDD